MNLRCRRGDYRSCMRTKCYVGARLRRPLSHATCLVLLAASAGAQQTVTVRGTVVDSLGVGIAGAEITWAVGDEARSRGATSAHSDSVGSFQLAKVPTGSVTLRVRRLGFGPRTEEIQVEGGSSAALVVRLAPTARRLPAVSVRELREPYDGRLAGYFARLAKGQGHFITRERLDRLTSVRLSDLLREVPGVRVLSGRGGGKVLSLRGSSCSPLFFIDGFPASAGAFDVDMIEPATLEGVEIHSGMATVPSELLGPRGLDRCGVVALWTRPAPSRRRAVRDSNGSDLALLLETGVVFPADDVDQLAVLEDSTARPVYPDSLWRHGTSGRVLLEFVVDTAGEIEPGTLGVVSATHMAFAAAAMAAFRDAQFRPATRNGRRVRQLVLLPVDFDPRARTTRAPAPR